MLSRIVKLIEARRALRAGRLHEALALADHEAICDDRRAREVREAARERLLVRAEERRARGELSGALIDLRSFLSASRADDRRGRELMEALRAALGARDEVRELERAAVEAARQQWARGWLHEARARLAPHVRSSDAAERLAQELDAAIARADAELDAASGALAQGDSKLAHEALRRLAALCPHHPGRERLEREILRRELGPVLARAAQAADEESLFRVWEELVALQGERPEVERLDELERVRARLRSLLQARLRTELLEGDGFAVGAAAGRWFGVDVLSGAELPDELAAGVEALEEAACLSALGLCDAPPLRLRRASGGLEVESALLQVGGRFELVARALREFTAQARRAIENGSAPAWREACSSAWSACPSARVFGELLAAVGGAAAELDREDDPQRALDEGRALRALAIPLCTAKANDRVALQALERLEHTRTQAEALFSAFAQDRFDAAEAERWAQRIAALHSLAADSPWVALLEQATAMFAASDVARREMKRSLASFDLVRAEACLAGIEIDLSNRREEGAESALGELVRRHVERDRRAFARAIFGAFVREGWRPLLSWLASPPPAVAAEAAIPEIRAAWSRRLEHEREKLRRDLERRRAGGGSLSAEEWEQARSMLPGDPLLDGLRDRSARRSALDERVRRAEWLTDRSDFSGAWDELSSIEEAGPFRTRIFDLKRRVQRERGLGERFFLRIEEGGEYLVVTRDRVRIGNARVAGNDLPILANISSHHAEIERSTSFHDGVRYVVKGIDSRPVSVGGAAVPDAGCALLDGAVMQLSAALGISFHQPSPRSQSAVLRLRGGFDVQGVERVVLLKPGGKSGRLLFGPEDRAHLRSPIEADLELWLDEGGQLRARASSPLRIDGHAVEPPEPVLPAGSWIECGGIRFAVDPG